MLHSTKHVLLVVDAQNGFCNPEGISHARHDITDTVKRIVLFREQLKVFGVPCLYLCMNEKVRSGMSRWETEMIQSLAPSVRERACWRDKSLEEPSSEECGLIEELQKTAGWKELHLLLCGFWTDNCVLHVGTEALRHEIRSTIVTDCVYPLFDTGMKEKNRKRMKEKYPKLNLSLLLFASQEDVLRNFSCAV